MNIITIDQNGIKLKIDTDNENSIYVVPSDIDYNDTYTLDLGSGILSGTVLTIPDEAVKKSRFILSNGGGSTISKILGIANYGLVTFYATAGETYTITVTEPTTAVAGELIHTDGAGTFDIIGTRFQSMIVSKDPNDLIQIVNKNLNL